MSNNSPSVYAAEESAAVQNSQTPRRRGHHDYFPDIAGERDSDLPRSGDPIWYRIRSDTRWVRAVVLDPPREGLEDPIGLRMLHLAVDLSAYNSTMTVDRKPDGEGGFYLEPDPERRLASSRLGFRLNVQEGTRPGEWQRERPANADQEYQQKLAEDAQRDHVRRDMAMHGSLQATHTTRLPKGVKAEDRNT